MKIMMVCALALFATVPAFADEVKTEFECRGASSTARSWVLVSELAGYSRVVRLFMKSNGESRLVKEVHGANSLGYFGITSFKNLEDQFVLDLLTTVERGSDIPALMTARVGNVDTFIEMRCSFN